MIPHAKPIPAFHYNLGAEIKALRNYRDTAEGRQIPAKVNNRLLMATWNLTNLGMQKRRVDDYRLMSEIISWFDIVAVQEIADDLSGLRRIMRHLPAYRSIISDPGGNNERLGYIYDPNKVELLEMIGEMAIPSSQHRFIRFRNVSGSFRGFDRNPYIASFKAGEFIFVLVCVHLFFGSNSWRDVDRRMLETYAVARWTNLRRRSDKAYSKNIIVLGDFNLPKREEGDRIYQALISRGLNLPEHTSKIGSSLKDDKDYDQMGFFPGPVKERFTKKSNVFDFDGGLFKEAWETRRKEFEKIIKFHVADHRPLWAEFKI